MKSKKQYTVLAGLTLNSGKKPIFRPEIKGIFNKTIELITHNNQTILLKDVNLATMTFQGTEEQIFNQLNKQLISMFAQHYSNINNTNINTELNILLNKYNHNNL